MSGCSKLTNIVTNFNQTEPLNSILTARQKAQVLVRLYDKHFYECDECQSKEEVKCQMN